MTGRKKLTLCLVLVFAMNILIISITQAAEAETYKKGSGGPAVAELQTALKNQGYYTGGIDGIYGKGTEAAVRAFQDKSGLTPDGNADSATLSALGLGSPDDEAQIAPPPFPEATPSIWDGGGKLDVDIDLLSRLISAEAKNEPYESQVAIGAVVLNRVKHPLFPNSLAGVIYQNGSYPCVTNGRFNEPAAEISVRAARNALNGTDPTGGAVYYYKSSESIDKSFLSMRLTAVIEDYRFCS